MPYKSLWILKKGFTQKSKSNFIDYQSSFLELHSTGNLRKEILYVLGIYVEIIYKKKGYCKLPVLLSKLFLQLFIHTR